VSSAFLFTKGSTIPYLGLLTMDKRGTVVPLIERGILMDIGTLVEENIRLAHFIANKFKNSEVEYDELFGQAQLGLFKAARTWDESKSKFATYACTCINNEILMYLRKVRRRGYMDSLDDIAYNGDPLSTTTGYDITPSGTDVENDVLFEFYMRQVNSFIESLPTREAYILTSYYGINGPELKQREIAESLGLAQSYVSRIIRKLTTRLKEELSIDEAV